MTTSNHRTSVFLISSCLAAIVMAGASVVKAAPALSTPPPQSAGQCIAPMTQKSVDSCSLSTPARMEKQVVAGGAPSSKVRAAGSRGPTAKRGPTGPSIELDLATRRNRGAVRARAAALLEREVQVLQRMVRNTSAEDPKRPDVLLRLAETYFETQTILTARVRSFDEPMFQAKQRKDGTKLRKLQQEQRQAEQQLAQVRQETLRAYALLVQDHPNYPRMDEVLFSLAFSLDELKQFDKARVVYHRLIKTYPNSRFIPNAYLSFAEFYFGEGDMEAALKFYEKVGEIPPSRNAVFGYALYKAAWAEYNLKSFKNALRKFIEVIDFGKQNSQANDVKNLMRQARRELVLPYSMVGAPEKALEFFRRYAESARQSLEMLETLAEIYFDNGQWDRTVGVYHRLMSESPNDEKVCQWQSRVTNAVVSSRPKADQVTEAQRMVDVYETFKSRGSQAPEAWKQCQQQTVSVLIWLATTWHRETVGSDQTPGTNDKVTMKQAAQLYRLILENFPELDKLEFKDIDRRDWPTRYRVSYYSAELLWKMNDWAGCGPAFDRVVELNPAGEFTSDAAYAAVLCYNNLYQQDYQKRERSVRVDPNEKRRKSSPAKASPGAEPKGVDATGLAPREFTELEQGMLNAFQRYVCFVPNSNELPTVKYRRARIFYEANHFEEAALLFRDIAWKHRESDLAVYAANLYLDSINALTRRASNTQLACVGELSAALNPLWGFYCESPTAFSQHGELCKVVQQLRCDVLRKEAEAYETQKSWKAAAFTYVKIFRKYRECGRLDEVLYNAAIDFESAHLVGRAIQVRKVLVEQYPESILSKRSIYLLGANFHALAFYEQAAVYYEQFAKKFPSEDGHNCTPEERQGRICPIAQEALMNAVFFRIGLGQDEKALEDARLFEAQYRTKLPIETSKVSFSLGTIYERKKQWHLLVEHYRKYLASYRRTALPHQVIRANTASGRAFWVRDDHGRAKEYFATAWKMWSSGAGVAIERLDVSDDEKQRYLFDAKDAASEAMFYLSEEKFEAFRRVRFPAYRGGRNLKRVNDWAKSEFSQWLKEKGAALKAAESEYGKIADLGVPQWQIAAAERVGEMYRAFVDDFRDAPVPEEIENDPELYDAYVGALDEQSEPLQRKAIDRFEFCLITATKVRWFNQWSRQCEDELNRLNPQEYPVAAELRGQPDRRYVTLGIPGAPDSQRVPEEASSDDRLVNMDGQ